MFLSDWEIQTGYLVIRIPGNLPTQLAVFINYFKQSEMRFHRQYDIKSIVALLVPRVDYMKGWLMKSFISWTEFRGLASVVHSWIFRFKMSLVRRAGYQGFGLIGQIDIGDQADC